MIRQESDGHCGAAFEFSCATRNLPSGTVLQSSDFHYKNQGGGTWTDPELTWNGLTPVANFEYKTVRICQDMVSYRGEGYKGEDKPLVGQKLKWPVEKGSFFSMYDFESTQSAKKSTK